MVLRATGQAPAGTDTFVQQQVWAKVKLHSTGTSLAAPPTCKKGNLAGFAKQHCYVCNSCWRCWASTTDALAKALGDFGAHTDIIRDNSAGRDTLLAAVVSSLDQSFPVIVGMSSDTHWEVLAGYCVDEQTPPDSLSIKVGTKHIRTFYVIDPFFEYLPGQLDAQPALIVLGGIGFANCGPGTDNGFSLAIVKGRIPLPPTIAISQMTNVPSNSGGPMRESSVVMESARLIQNDLALTPEWQYAFEGAELQKPIAIQHLDDRDGYFYIADFTKPGGVTGRVVITLDPLRIIRVHGMTIPGTYLRAFVKPEDTINAREGRPFSDDDDRIVRKDAIGIAPVLVWRDCAQSHNEMWPFYVITHGDRRYYQRVDGAIFPELTPSLPGH